MSTEVGTWPAIIGTNTSANLNAIRERVKNTPAQALVDSSVPDLVEPHWTIRWNIILLLWLSMIERIVAMALWIAVAFVAVGFVTVDEPLTLELTGQQTVTALVRWSALGENFILTPELLWLAGCLGAIAALTFVTVRIQESDARGDFADDALAGLRVTVSALVCYYGARRGVAQAISQVDVSTSVVE